MLDRALESLAAFGIPLLIVLFSLLAYAFWPAQFAQGAGQPLSFRVLNTPVDLNRQLDMVAVRANLASRPLIKQWETRLSEDPLWFLVDTEGLPVPQSPVVTIPSRHASQLTCWNADTLGILGTADRTSVTGLFHPSRAGFALRGSALPSKLLCMGLFSGPAKLTVALWEDATLQEREFDFVRSAGLLEGGMLVLAIFVLIAGFINRNSSYLQFAAWLVLNLRMAAISAGWDFQWLGHDLPDAWLLPSRQITLALYYTVTFVFFTSLFKEELKSTGHQYLYQLAKWSCPPLLVLSVALPFALFLSIYWIFAGIGVALLLSMLVLVLWKTRSLVAIWYAASISIALFASLFEVMAASLGLNWLAGSFNSVTAALASSLLTSLALAEHMRQEHAQRLEAQRKLQNTYAVMPIGLFTLHLKGGFISYNPALESMLKGLPGHPSTHDWPQLFSAAEWERLRRELDSGQAIEIEMEAGSNPSRRFLTKATLSGDKIEGSLQDITEKARATEHLQFLANHDTLTRVLNRRGIEAKLQTGLYRLSRGQPLSVAYLDLDRFKLINDLYGHTAGDAVLQEICARAQAPLRSHMHLGRVGGDEFLLVMSDTPLSRAEAVCRQILDSITGSPCQVGDRAFQVRGSIGLIEVSAGASAKDVVSTADHACREAKQDKGVGLVVYERGSRVFTEHEAELQLIERLATEQQIEGLFLEMQPIMSLRQPFQSLNFEVLLRMHDAEGQRVPTDRLIRAGENAGRMGVIDRWVLTHTLQWLHEHAGQLPKNQFVCMNLSGASLNDERFMEDVFQMLQRYPTEARQLCLEVTESVALHDMGNTRHFIERVRRFGAKVALDDFGAGYTSFSYLKDLPADLLKIDGSFIVDMNRHPANIAIVEAIVSLAQNLGMKTIAEWAEDAPTVETLAEIGVDYVQGFVVSRPQAPDRLLQAGSAAHFIQDPQLSNYLQGMAQGNGLDVDLVLGTPPSTSP